MATKTEKTLWGIHAGRTGDAYMLFLKHNVIALGWPKMGDLSSLPADREAFRNRLMEAEPGLREKQNIAGASQLFRFVHEAKKGDLVVYPSKNDRKIHIGEIIEDYRYNPKIEAYYPHHRPVKWIQEFPRTRFSQGALYETGSAMSFFQVKNYAHEFLSALSGKEAVITQGQDESVSYVVEEIEQNTRDYVIKILAQELKGHGLADFVSHLLGKMGYQTRLSPEGPDGGVDIVAHKDELGFEPPIIKIQIKSTEGSVGDPIVSQLYGKVERSEYGMVVTLGSFTNQAQSFERNKSNLRLIDGDQLVELIFKHYDAFDSSYKALIPLKRVYVPAPIEDEGDEDAR
jgi:restriction system protein